MSRELHKGETDLQKFQRLFDALNMRTVKNGLEVRVANLDAGKHDAGKLIKNHGLNLELSTEGSMVNLRAFLVKEVAA